MDFDCFVKCLKKLDENRYKDKNPTEILDLIKGKTPN